MSALDSWRRRISGVISVISYDATNLTPTALEALDSWRRRISGVISVISYDATNNAYGVRFVAP